MIRIGSVVRVHTCQCFAPLLAIQINNYIGFVVQRKHNVWCIMAMFQIGLGIGTIQFLMQFDSYLIRFNRILFHLEIVVLLNDFYLSKL